MKILHPTLLMGHCDLVPLFRRDLMSGIFCVLAQVNLYPLDLPVELRAGTRIVVTNRCAAVATNVCLVVQGKEHRGAWLDAPLAGLPAVDVEGDIATLAQAASIVGELHPNLVLARRNRLFAFDLRTLDAEEVVVVGWAAILHVDAPASEHTSLRDDDALCTALGNDNLSGDRMRLVLDVQDNVFREATHSGVEHLRVTPDQLRTAGDFGIEALSLAVVDRQHVVADCLDEKQALQLAQLLGHLLREVVGLRPVVRAIQLPHIVIELGNLYHHEPRCAVSRARGPTLAIDAAVGKYLEVLRIAELGRTWIGEGRI